MSSILTAPLFAYDKSKNLLLKAVLPFLIIVHHVLIALPSNGLQFIEQCVRHIVLWITVHRTIWRTHCNVRILWYVWLWPCPLLSQQGRVS